MKKLSEYKDEDALDLFADLIDPITDIMGDKEVVNSFTKESKIKGIQMMIKKHKGAVFQCLAILEGIPVEEYHCDILSLPKTILEIMNDEGLMDFFKSQGQQMEEESFGSVMENSGEEE